MMVLAERGIVRAKKVGFPRGASDRPVLNTRG
jgi:hypothetical protein